MRIFLASDIHFEFHRDEPDWLPPLPEESEIDVLVLAGDIGTYTEAIKGIERILNYYVRVPIIYIAGNHEFYGFEIRQAFANLRTTYASHPRVHFMEQDSIELNGYRILGCTLWTGFDCLDEKARKDLLLVGQHYLNDFKVIKLIQNGQKTKLTPTDMSNMYQQSRQWLESQLKDTDTEKTIVITHFPPGRIYRHMLIREEMVSAYFQANCQDLIDAYQPALWLYGHNHYSRVDHSCKTLLVSNQFGYPGEYTGYQQNLIIEKQAGLPWQVKGAHNNGQSVMLDES